ncbi:MAG: Phosphate acetyltransferase [Verrucomicrobia subdivision 3 bacterium]|nr:Phosphate acetyltransferase [Limisphaerales bacterium]MCS1416452.1 Phosphate acetyltransferase [Limisphaerales bacterium]
MVDGVKFLKNSTTPRLFVAATRQNDGKTTTSLGLLAAIQQTYPRVGYIKPVGQRFVDIQHQKIDEDTVLMDRVYGLNCPLNDMSPIAVETDFTRRYLRTSNYAALASRIQRAFDRVAWEKDLVVCEGTGHAGVGSVFDLSNARVAKLVGAKVVIVTRGGIGRPIDEVALNQALFEKEDVDIIGVILNKVMPNKVEQITEFAQKGLRRRGLDLLGVIPHVRLLSSPTMDLIREELQAEPINGLEYIHSIVDDVVVGAMSVAHARKFFRAGALLIVHGDREDLIESLAVSSSGGASLKLAGMILTDDLKPNDRMIELIRRLPYPVLLTSEGSYDVASKVRDVIVKTRSDDTEKISLIRDLIRSHVDVSKILNAII